MQMTWAATFFGSVVVLCVAALVAKWMDEVARIARRVTVSKPKVTDEEAARAAIKSVAKPSWTR